METPNQSKTPRPGSKHVTFQDRPSPQSRVQCAPCTQQDAENEPCITLNEPAHHSGCPEMDHSSERNTQPYQAGSPRDETPRRQCPTDSSRELNSRAVLPEIPRKKVVAPPPMQDAASRKVICPEHVREKDAGERCPAHLNAGEAFGAPSHSLYDGTTAAQRLTDKLKEMQIEEDFRRENPTMRRMKHKFHGMCGTLGNPVFTDTPVSPPGYQAKPPARLTPRYPAPLKQHPMYKTTSAGIGGKVPYLECTPISYHPNDQSFTIRRAIGGMYEDVHLTTELNKHPFW